MDRLVLEHKLSQAVRTELDPSIGKPLAKHHVSIASAIENYLAHSKEFQYSLQLQRQDRSIDPAEDFLFNTKTGHCQRFATAMTLILRSQGIPARFVIGFKGFETQGQGKYVVRQSQAHAWVEALIRDDSGPNLWFNMQAAIVGVPAAVASIGNMARDFSRLIAG